MLKRAREIWHKLIPAYAELPLIICGVAQFLVYFCTKLIPHPEYVDIMLPIDSRIQVAPIWIIPYVGAYVFWVIGYIGICRAGKNRCRELCRADYISKVVALAFFVLMPTTLERPEVTSGGICGWMLRFIWAADTPNNLFPSLHCLTSWLIARELLSMKEAKAWYKLAAVAASVLVFFSTLFTRQHVVVDIFGGVAVAEIALAISRMCERRRNGAAKN